MYLFSLHGCLFSLPLPRGSALLPLLALFRARDSVEVMGAPVRGGKPLIQPTGTWTFTSLYLDRDQSHYPHSLCASAHLSTSSKPVVSPLPKQSFSRSQDPKDLQTEVFQVRAFRDTEGCESLERNPLSG